MTPETKYVQVSDKTLWLLQSRSMVLPVYVMKVSIDGNGDEFFWFIWPAMEFREFAYRWFIEAMKAICDVQVGKYWRCPDPTKISDMLEKAEGVTPEFYYRDNQSEDDKAPTRVTISGETVEITPGIQEEFIDALVERTALTSKPTMKVILNALNQVILEWLIVKRKPVNIGFATIVPLPYRENWKAALLRFFPKAANIFSRKEGEIESYAEEVGLMSAFLSKELLSIDKERNTCEWKLEIHPNKLFTETSKQAENTKIGQLSGAKYSDSIAYEIAKSRKVILTLFRYYVERSMRPFASFSKVANRDGKVLLPCTWGGQSNQKRLESAHSDLVLTGTVDWKKPSIKSLVAETVRDMPDVSDARQQSAELRIAREDDR